MILTSTVATPEAVEAVKIKVAEPEVASRAGLEVKLTEPEPEVTVAVISEKPPGVEISVRLIKSS
jgi:hypothetical protein